MISFAIPDWNLWNFAQLEVPVPPSPFKCEWLSNVFFKSMEVQTPLTIATVYFLAVHIVNPMILKRQINQATIKEKDAQSMGAKDLKRLKPAPFAMAKLPVFKWAVLLHNMVLCVYSAWTFVGILGVFSRSMTRIQSKTETDGAMVNFVHAVCDVKNGIFKQDAKGESLMTFGWWFYMSKFYEVLDTVIILLRGRPSSLLQSYHHAGAMMCMWGGIRYQSPPIWIFVVFNSFIHTLMYFYFTLSCLKIKVPTILKRSLTFMQICQFIVGGSVAIMHAFITYQNSHGKYIRCIESSAKAFPLIINVAYLAPLTALFAAFYAENYLKRKLA